MRKVTIRDSKRRAHFGEILEEWCDVVERYTNEFSSEDALYWYNERATLSSFSVAAGRKNFHVLEEYSAKKKAQQGGTTYRGRADLFLAKGRTEYIIEAKQKWVSISGRVTTDPNKKITSALNSARGDAAASNVGGVPVFGLVFAVPYIPKTQIERAGELISEFTSNLGNIDYDAMAYVFPEKAETVCDKGVFYPGVACIIRAPRRKF